MSSTLDKSEVWKKGKHTAIRERSLKIPFKNTQHCLREYLSNIHMAANKAVNGCITANKRHHLVGLPIKTQVRLQLFKSVFSCCGRLMNH